MNELETSTAQLQRFLVVELARRLEIDPELVDPRQPFERYGLDSLNALRLSAELEERIGTKLSTTVLWDYPSIESLAQYLVRELNVREVNQDRSNLE